MVYMPHRHVAAYQPCFIQELTELHLCQMASEGSVALPGMSQLDLLPKLTCDDRHIRKTFHPIFVAVLHSAHHQACYSPCIRVCEHTNTAAAAALCLGSYEVDCSSSRSAVDLLEMLWPSKTQHHACSETHLK